MQVCLWQTQFVGVLLVTALVLVQSVCSCAAMAGKVERGDITVCCSGVIETGAGQGGRSGQPVHDPSCPHCSGSVFVAVAAERGEGSWLGGTTSAACLDAIKAWAEVDAAVYGGVLWWLISADQYHDRLVQSSALSRVVGLHSRCLLLL
jgi:hypothetical protein